MVLSLSKENLKFDISFPGGFSMNDKKIIVLVVAALFVGLATGILAPKFFGSKPDVSTVSRPAPSQAPPPATGTNYTLKISELKRRLQSNPNDVALLIQLGNTYFDNRRIYNGVFCSYISLCCYNIFNI